MISLTTGQRAGYSKLLDQHGQPFDTSEGQRAALARVQDRFRQLRASYDAAADPIALQLHWANADNRSPNSANGYGTRKKLRSRSRYEVIENNPYLKGIILTVANDFIGTGPKLQITDKRIPEAKRPEIEAAHRRWAKRIKYRQKLWRLRMAKMVDGEGFKRAYTDYRTSSPMKLNFQVFEAEQCTSNWLNRRPDFLEYDGVRVDENADPISYFVLNQHPGDGNIVGSELPNGAWMDAKYVTHWFRQERSWCRGIPETTPSLPLCAFLRRYTLAVVKAAEIAADFSAVLEGDAPPGAQVPGMTGTPLADDPFDTFPISQGMFVTLPWGYKMNQMKAEQPTLAYDMFISSLLMEISRPLLVPYNYASGSSKDSNMASGVLDSNIYKEGIKQERINCEENVLDPDLDLWWEEAALIGGYLPVTMTRSLREEPPEHDWRWDRVGLDHTDPQKVITALKVAHDKGFITDGDVQEGFYNRSEEEWQEGMLRQQKFRKTLGPGADPFAEDPNPPPAAGPNGKPPSKNGKPAVRKSPSRNGSR